jgi:hypothetical protein
VNEVDDLETLRARVRALERQNRLVIIGVVIAGLFLAAASHVSSQPATLRARTIELAGRQGRILLSADEGIVRLSDASGRPRVVLALSGAEPGSIFVGRTSIYINPNGVNVAGRAYLTSEKGLQLTSGDEEITLSLSQNIPGSRDRLRLPAGLMIRKKFDEIISLSLADRTSPTGLHISGKDEFISLSLADPTLSTGLHIGGKHESITLHLGGSGHILPQSLGLIISGRDGGQGISLELPEDGQARVQLHDAAGFKATLGNVDLEVKSTGSTIHRSAASLTLFDSRGTVLWETP